MLRAFDFTGGNNTQPLIAALAILLQLNATGARKVPEGAPTDFVPARWRGYLEQAARSGDAVSLSLTGLIRVCAWVPDDTAPP